MSDARPRITVEPLGRSLLEGVHELDGDDDRVRVDLGLVLVFSDERPLHGLAGLIDWRRAGRLSALLRSGFCTAVEGEQLLLPGDARLPVDRLVLVGLGPRASFEAANARSVALRLVEISAGLRARTVLIALPTLGMDRAVAEVVVEALVTTLEERVTKRDDEAEAADPVGDLPHSTGNSQRGPVVGPDGEPDGDRHETRWWVAADEAIAPRLRRVLSGPPRAARGSVGLHT